MFLTTQLLEKKIAFYSVLIGIGTVVVWTALYFLRTELIEDWRVREGSLDKNGYLLS